MLLLLVVVLLLVLLRSVGLWGSLVWLVTRQTNELRRQQRRQRRQLRNKGHGPMRCDAMRSKLGAQTDVVLWVSLCATAARYRSCR